MSRDESFRNNQCSQQKIAFVIITTQFDEPRIGGYGESIVTARHTKNGRPRDIPMNDDVRQALADLCKDKRPDDYVFVSEKTGSCVREVKKGFHTACRIAGIEGLIWKDLRATFGTRLAEAGCDAFTIAQLLGHSDVRVTMRYVRSVEDTKRAAVQAIKLSSRKSVHKLATNEIRPPVPAAVND